MKTLLSIAAPVCARPDASGRGSTACRGGFVLEDAMKNEVTTIAVDWKLDARMVEKAKQARERVHFLDRLNVAEDRQIAILAVFLENNP